MTASTPPRYAAETIVDLGDVRLHVRRLGDPARPPLLVVHGGPSWDHSYLLPAVGLVADIRHVVLVDLRGCGRSSRDLPIEAYQHELAAEDLSRLVERLRLAPVDLLGFSYGGSLALRMLDRHPGQVRSLVLASASAYAGTLDPDLEAERRRREDDDAPPFGDPLLDDETRTRQDALASAAVSVWDLSLLPLWRRTLAGVRFSGDWLAPYEAGLLGRARPDDPAAILRRTRCPTLLLHGAKDMGFPVTGARALHAAVPHTELAVVEDAAHMAQFERPVEWSARLRRFLTAGIAGTDGAVESPT